MHKGLSLRWRMILIVAGIPLLFLIPGVAFLGQQYRSAYRDAFWSRATLVAEQLAQTIETVRPFIVTVADAPDLEQHLKRIADSTDDVEFVALVDAQGRILMHSRPGYAGRELAELRELTSGAIRWVGEGPTAHGITPRNFASGLHHLVWRAIAAPGNTEEVLYIVVAGRASLTNPSILPLVVAAGMVAATVVLLIRLSLQRLVLRPLDRLAEGAALVGAGDLDHRVAIQREDEFGLVAQAFNAMTERLGQTVERLEHTVAERTAALERRNAQLEAVSIVGQEATRERNVAALLETAVNAISKTFGFYHTGIFILDDSGVWAVLQAASSEGGRRMRSRGHRLRVGQMGIVGYVAATGKPRVAFDVDQDAVWFNNPDLPDTRSEMALPLISEEQVIGVLDVQSDEEAAFSDEDMSTLQLMADQLAVALINARTLEAMASALVELRELQVDYGRRGWARVTQRKRPLAYEYDRVDTRPVPPLAVPTDLAEGQASHAIVMEAETPMVMEALRVGDQTLGYLGLSDPERAWSDEELTLVQSVGEQIALALDNARLFEDTQRNERQQYLISSVLQVASNPELTTEEVLEGIARVLAQGLDVAIVIFTFPYAELPIARAQAFVDPEGEQLPLIDEPLTLSRQHHAFFRSLREPELGSMVPWMDGVRATPDAERFLESRNLEQVLYVPIASTGEQSGFIGLISGRDMPPLDPDTWELAQNLASQIGVVLDNLNLSEETRRRSEELRQLYRLSLTLSEMLEPTEVLETTISQGARLLGADAANLWLYDADAALLELHFDYNEGAEGRVGHRMPADQGLAGQALTEQRTIFVEDYSRWEASVAELASTQFRGMMAIPLIGRFGPLGVLVVLSRRIAAFGEREAGLADLFSAQAATALENARLTQDAQRRAEEFSQLYDAGIDLITILDARELLDRAADWARRVFSAERAVVFLHDESTGRYVRGTSVSHARYLFSQDSDEPSQDGLTATLIQSRESVLVRDNRRTSVSSAQRLIEAGLLSQMGAPLSVGDEVLGALFVNGASPNQFDDRDLNLLEFLATQISSALQNSIQFGQTEQALAMVGRQARYQANVSQAVALLNDQGTAGISDVLRLLGEAANVAAVLYFEVQREGATLFWRPQSSWLPGEGAADALDPSAFQRLAVADFPFWAQQLLEQGAVMERIEHLPPAEREFLTAYELGAVLALAVSVEEAAPGFVALFREAPELWEDQEIIALQTVAAALSNTLAREHLFDQVQQTLNETEALYRGSATLSEASTYEDILKVLLAHTVLGQEAQNASLQLFDRPWTEDQRPEFAEMVVYWSNQPAPQVRRRYRLDDFPQMVHVVENGEPIFIDNLGQGAPLDRRARAIFQRALGAQSLIVVPLVVSGQRVGFLHADYAQPQHFSGTMRRRLVSLAQQAAIAVLNIRQLQATEARVRREQLIRQITSRVQEAPDVQGVLQTAVRELGRALGTSRNRIQFYPPTGDGDDRESSEQEA